MRRRTALRAAGATAATVLPWAAACGGPDKAPAPGRTSSAANTSATAHRPSATASAPPSSAPPADKASWAALARDLDGSLIRPSDARYATARRLYNTRFDTLRPAALAYVQHPEDVATCLAFARRHAVPVAIRSGGHSYAGFSSGDGRLVVDVSALNTVAAPSRGTVTVGAGTRLMELYTGLDRHGVTVPAGSCPTVGVSGLTLGGGHGVTSRAYGLTCDNLVGATLVTADGRTLECDRGRHSDLFWALRGAGNGNFGVVTSLRLRTHPAPDGVTAYLTWPWSRAGAVLRSWQEWGPTQADEIWSSCHLTAGSGSPTVSVAAFSLGTYGDLQNAVDRLADRAGGPGPASSVSLRPTPYLRAMESYAGCSSDDLAQCHLPGSLPGREAAGRLARETYAARSHFFDRSLDSAAAGALQGQVEAAARRGVNGDVALTALGGAVGRVGVTDTAFVHRRARFLAQYLASWPQSGSSAAASAWLSDVHRAMQRAASGAYQNYADAGLKDWRAEYYGPAADRLADVKRSYDPDGLFRSFAQAL
ncbi:FAD-binding oxidoreductase [Streptomyces sp. NPDC059740]|uniref:FAD-binding oxidoreductase n=1 Tax=Streptomyces sp. NPDC059740 TaxID=3346926 RepID=UPI00365A983E